MVQSHHDSVGTGAVEDATGTAEVIALAETTAVRPSSPATVRAKSLMFVTFDTHFTGYQAHQAFVDRCITRRATLEHRGQHHDRACRKIRARAANGKLITTDRARTQRACSRTSISPRSRVGTSVDTQQRTVIDAAQRDPVPVDGDRIPTDASFS